MKLTTLACSLMAGATLLALPAAVAAQKNTETETVNKTVPFPDRGTLKVHSFSGRVKITGTSGRDVVVTAVRRAERDRLDHIKFTVETQGSTVVIEANKKDDGWRERNNNVVDTEMEIQVPASAELNVDCFSSQVEIAGVNGDQRLHTFSGDVTVTGAKGAMELDTFSGDLDVDLTGAGASPDVRGKTFSGDIRVRLAQNAKGAVTFSSHSGDFDTDIPLAMRSSKRNRVTADLPGGSSGHALSFNTFSGSVRILK